MDDMAFSWHSTNVKKDLLFAKNISIIVESKPKMMTGYQDYLIVLSPSESIIDNVKRLKDFSYQQIGEYDSHYSKAHITVQPWPRKRPVWIEPLIPKLERDLQTLPPVILDINGFNFFDHPDHPSIYAKLNSTALTKIWFKYLRKFFHTSDFEPHITIARSIPNESFTKLWPHFKDQEWNEQFIVDKLTILRRETIGHDKSYRVFKEIPFNNNLDFYTFTNLKLTTPALPLNKVNMQQISLF
jgi:2'-5' RNA ligase